MTMKISVPVTKDGAGPGWLKRVGVAGFTFFFLKGMAWLLIPWLAHSALF